MENQDFDHCSASDIAVIGMSCRFPGAGNVEEFWKNLSEGVESIIHFSDEDLTKQGIDPSVLNDPSVVKAAARIDGIDLFDASFFGYSPREAEAIDPQQRIFLECADEALECSGHDPDRFEGLVGVYGGSGVNTYLMRILAQPWGDAAQNLNSTLGNDKDYLCTRVSYKLNLRGPSVCVQSACSTSLVAVHLACQGLLDYECDMALAGGVSVRAPQPLFYRYLEGSIMSPDGHCRAFDADARGTVFGNGAGVVVLRRLEDALKDGDNIFAVIKGSAINNDGAAKVGYTAPGVEGHVEVIRTAWARADVDPSTISLIEAHGTGTPLGDPIEISALTQAFQTKTDKTSFCALGSVKTNIGHLDTAAGVAGLIKAILALKHGHIPPSLHFRSSNPQLNLERTPFFVNTRLRIWEAPGPRRAAVSSLGIGGTNAHIVLQEAPRKASPSSWSKYQLLTLSAKTESALESMTEQVYQYCRHLPEVNIADLAFTYQTGRKQMAHRRVVLCNQGNFPCLPEAGSAEIFAGTVRKARPKVVFMFPGQGSQYPQMAKELYEAHPVFRKNVDAQLTFLKSEFNVDLRSVIFPTAERLESNPKELNQTALAQPALFIIEYALAQLLFSWGIRPDAMIGHSLGEFVAACVAGVFSSEQALRIVVNRGRFMQQQAPGAMLAVTLGEDAVNRWLKKDLSLAVVNGPGACVVSGTVAAIHELKDKLAVEGIKSQVLETSHAYHSQMMEPALAPFEAVVARERLQAPALPYVSNVTGEWIEAAQATDPAYWAKQLRETVRFGKSITEVLKAPNTVLVEIGPGHALSSSCKQHDRDVMTVSSLPSRTQHDAGKSDLATVLIAVGRLWIEGVAVKWEALHQDERRHRLPAPTYPYERQSYWIGGDQPFAPATQQAGIKREAIDDWFYVPVWQQTPPLPALPQRILPKDGCWLILMDECGVGDRLLQHLESASEKVVAMRTSSDQAKGQPFEYVFSSRNKESLEALLKELRRSKLLPHTIVNLWTVSATPEQSPGTRALQEFINLVESAQAISAAGGDSSLEMFIVSNGFCDLVGNEQVSSEKAPLAAAAQVISQECPGLQCRCIQLPNGWQGQISSQQASELVHEMRIASHAPVVAHELNCRWTQTYSKASLPHASIDKTPLKKGGTYLITGGLGGLGLVLADFLALELQAQLVLVNSSKFPAREMWNAHLLKPGEEDRICAQITRLMELEKAGSKVMVLSADVSDKAQLESAFQAACSEFGKIDGVFHLAGVPGAGLVQFKDRDTSSRVFRPKVLGTEVLANAAQRWSVDFLLMFSSITSVTGGIGQVDYSAASRFVDAVAQNSKQNSQVRTISIAWDAWASDTWQDPGLAAFPKLRDMLKHRRKQYGITSAEGMEVLQRVLASSLCSLIVSTQNLEKAIESHDRYSRSIVKDQLTRAEVKAAQPRSATRAGYVAPRNSSEEKIAELWEKVLGIHPVGIYDDFIELGGHSLLAIELTARLRESFHTDMPLKAIFECRTVASLAAMISQEKPGSAQADIEALLAEIERLSPEEVQAQIQHLQQ
jgi:acyl transferase domain-containing protein/acyl carrier protein